jgi:hypothetical protein
MNRKTYIPGALIGAFLLAPCSVLAAARTPAQLVEEANEAFARGEYAEAATVYEEAGRALPDSPQVEFNLANARFKQGELDAARDKYLAVLDSAHADELLRRRAHYNLGNTAFREAEQKLADGDLEGAVASLRDSVRLYQRAGGGERPVDDELAADARWNIEVTRARMKRILDELQRRREQQEEQTAQNRELQEKLDEAIAEQEKIAEQAAQPEASDEEREALQQQQKENLDRTGELDEALSEQIEQADNQPDSEAHASGTLRDAQQHIDQGQAHQAEAAEHVQNDDMERAQRSAEEALEELKQAREKLSEQQAEQPATEQDTQHEADEQQDRPEHQAAEQGDRREQAEASRLSKEEAQRLLEELKRDQAKAREARVRELEERGYRPFEKQQYEGVIRDW